MLRRFFGWLDRTFNLTGSRPTVIPQGDPPVAQSAVTLSEEVQRMVADGCRSDESPTPVEIPLRGSVRDRISRGRL
jgi:hypothetical protein